MSNRDPMPDPWSQMPQDMQPSSAAGELINRSEGLRLVSYEDPAGIWTIGYGHTANVGPNQTCTPFQAECWLRADMETAAKVIRSTVTVPLTQGMFDAITSWVFNLGALAWEHSSCLRELNEGDYRGCMQYMQLYNRGGGKVLAGLVSRRSAEAALFCKADPVKAASPVAPTA